jgi:Uma2 family endonuclease
MAAHPIAPLMTADTFANTYGDGEDNRYELIDGEVYPRTMPSSPHDSVKNNLKELFDRSGVNRAAFRCWIEHTFRMSETRVFVPDVAIIRTERLIRHAGYTLGAPEIAIEIAINDAPSVLQRKVSDYLENGSIAVCCVYPDSRNIVVYTAREWRRLSESDALEFPELLPGLRIPLAAIFEDL